MLEVKNRRIHLVVPYDHKDTFKLIRGCQWHKSTKMWSIPIDARERMYELFPNCKKKVEPSVMQYIKKWQKIRKDREETYQNKTLDYKFKRKPYDHQKEMMKRAIVEEKYAFFTEMGTGKSQAMVNCIDYLIQNSLAINALIVCPKTIIQNWAEEVKVNSNLEAITLEGTKKQRLSMMSATASESNIVSIINYEGIRVLEDCGLWNEYDIVVLDESSKIKNGKAQITKMILKLFKDTQYKYIMSGTPLQEPLDIYTQFKFLDENYLGFKSYFSFRGYYTELLNHGAYKEVIGYKNLSELKTIISRHSIQLKKEQCIDLPDKLYTKRLLPLEGEVKRQYMEMKKDLAMSIGDEDVVAPIILTKLLRLQEITSGVYLTERKDNQKLKETMDVVKDNIGDTQIIIWCRFLKSMDVLMEGLEAEGIPFAMIRGDVKDRQGQINRFQNGEAKVFLGQIQTGGMGITLTAGSMVIYYENTFSLAERKQSEDRCHRIGQKKNVTYIDIGYNKTIDTDIIAAIAERQDVAVYLVNSFKKGEYK